MTTLKTTSIAALASLVIAVGAINTAAAVNERNNDRWSRSYKPGGHDRRHPSIRGPSTQGCFRLRTRNGTRTICR
jgi:hypothetical protein